MEENEEILIFSSINENEINQICALLVDNEIPFVRKDDGSGSYMTIYMGFSIQEKRIFVDEKDYEKAEKLISSIFSNNDIEFENIPELEEDPMSEKEEEEAKKENEKYYKKQSILKKFMKFFLVYIGIIILILSALLG